MSDLIKQTLDEEKSNYLKNICADVKNRTEKLSLGYSEFQIKNFIVAAQITPARQYKQLLLELEVRLGAMEQRVADHELAKIDLEEMVYKLESPETDQFEKKRLQIKLQVAKRSEQHFEKQVKEALREIQVFYNMLEQMPELTQGDIESEESLYFKEKLSRETQYQGAMLSLITMEKDTASLNAILAKEPIENLLSPIKNKLPR